MAAEELGSSSQRDGGGASRQGGRVPSRSPRVLGVRSLALISTWLLGPAKGYTPQSKPAI